MFASRSYRSNTLGISLTVGLLVVLLLFAAGCKGKNVETTPAAPVEPPTEQAPPPRAPVETEPRVEVVDDFGSRDPDVQEIEQPSIDEWNRRGVLRTIFFEFDRSTLSEQARRTLRDNANWLNGHPEISGVVVEGHCDERGTIEYNLALGQRRARSVIDYLVNLGVASSRLRPKTYGEEQPIARGNGEAAWSQNRRAEFLIER